MSPDAMDMYNRVDADGNFKMDIWLLWTMNTDGRTYLRGVATSEDLVKKWKRVTECEPTCIRAFAERSRGNHLYGSMAIRYDYDFNKVDTETATRRKVKRHGR